MVQGWNLLLGENGYNPYLSPLLRFLQQVHWPLSGAIHNGCHFSDAKPQPESNSEPNSDPDANALRSIYPFSVIYCNRNAYSNSNPVSYAEQQSVAN